MKQVVEGNSSLGAGENGARCEESTRRAREVACSREGEDRNKGSRRGIHTKSGHREYGQDEEEEERKLEKAARARGKGMHEGHGDNDRLVSEGK